MAQIKLPGLKTLSKSLSAKVTVACSRPSSVYRTEGRIYHHLPGHLKHVSSLFRPHLSVAWGSVPGDSCFLILPGDSAGPPLRNKASMDKLCANRFLGVWGLYGI